MLTSYALDAEVRPATANWLSSSNNISQQFLAFGGRNDVVSLAGGLPAAELYPVEAIQAAARLALETHGSAVLEYGAVEGFLPLRELIAERMSRQTGGSFTAANVLLTTGAMQGLDLIGKVLLDRDDLVVTQSPTYLGALDAWRPRTPSYRKLDWACTDASSDAVLPDAKFVYVVPNFSNPTGVLVPQDQRAALLRKVVDAGTWLIEDDPYHSIALDGPTGANIIELYVRDNPGPYSGPVIYLGTVSKSIVPGLRVGWMIAEPNMIQNFALAKQSSDMSSSVLTQAITFELLATPFEGEHRAQMVETYRERRDVLCREAAARLGKWFEWSVPVGGMFVWMRSKGQLIDTTELYRFAVEEKVAFVPSVVFDFADDDRFAMRLNFTRSSPELLVEGVRRLQVAVERYLMTVEQEAV